MVEGGIKVADGGVPPPDDPPVPEPVQGAGAPGGAE